MLQTIKRDWQNIILQSVAFAVTLIILLLLASYALGGPQQQAQLVEYQKAVACELAVPIGPNGRDPHLVAKCFTDQGVQPPTFQGA